MNISKAMIVSDDQVTSVKKGVICLSSVLVRLLSGISRQGELFLGADTAADLWDWS